jgi:hypothetical protein
MMMLTYKGYIMMTEATKKAAVKKAIVKKVFHGGIQKGTMAWDEESKKLDGQLNRIAHQLKDDSQIVKAGITFQKKLTKAQVPGGMVGCAPDGGCWFKDGVLIAAFEAKKQGERGNAIERWYKNWSVLRRINQSITYVTFTSGLGAVKTGPIGRTLAHAVLSGKLNSDGSFDETPSFNKLRIGKDSVFMNPKGFSDEEIFKVMKKAILSTPSTTKIVKIREDIETTF